MYSVKSRSQTIRENITLMPEGFGGWFAKNIGTGNVEVDGFVLEPGDTLDFSHLQPTVVWESAITVVCAENGILRLTRFKYTGEGDKVCGKK